MHARVKPQLSNRQLKILEQETRRECVRVNEQYMKDIEIMWMWVLHKQLNFGKKRLKKAYIGFNNYFKEILDRYVFDGPDDVIWYIKRELKSIDVDVDSWRTEVETVNNESSL